MPGIAGFISKMPIQINKSNLEMILKPMQYEDFYTSGKYINEGMNVYVGWVVHRESFCDCMPIYNETKDIILIFYGENHFNEDVINKLKINYHDVSTIDASYLIHLYEELGDSFFVKLNGWFCGLLIDLRKKKVILFNDRYGMQRLYLHERKDSFYFASEAKCILKIKPELKNISDQSLAELFSYQCVLENRSLFQEIYLMPGGSCWEIQHGKEIYRHSYFDPTEFEELPLLERNAFFTKLKEIFREILPKYFQSNGQIAFSLTGGLDTRTILANIPNSVTNVQTYSHCGTHRDCYDVKIARKVAAICGLPHHTLRIDEQFIADFPVLAEKTAYITDGYMDLNGTPSLYLHGKARKIGNLRLTGNFGDQVLHNIINLKLLKQNFKLIKGDLLKNMDKAPKCLRDLSDGHPLSFFLFKQAPWFDYSRFALEQSQMVQRSPFMDNDLVKLLYQAPKGMLVSEDIRIRLIKEGNADLAKIPTDRGYLGSNNYFVSNILHLYREYLFKLEYYFSYGMPQWLARLNEVVGFLNLDYLFLERNKYYNFRRWFRYELADYLKEILLDDRTLKRPFINRSFVEDIVAAHTTGQGNYTSEINRILSIELALRSLIEDI